MTTPTTTMTSLSSPGNDVQAFTFGQPESVLDGHWSLLDMLQCDVVGGWYDPPVSLDELSRTFHAAVHHSSPIYVKRNILLKTYKSSKKFSKAAFSRWALDYLIFGNAYLEKITDRNGNILQLKPMPALFTRRSVHDLDTYYWLDTGNLLAATPYEAIEMAKGSVHHLAEPDVRQEIYGLPEYLSALQSTLLNESATLFRRRYYLNGSHAGYILYLTDTLPDQEDVTALRTALKNSKGPGNFRNLFFHSPGGKPDGMKLIPVAEVAAKDGFGDIKNTTRDDLLSAHRVPPQLMGILPHNTSGFGDVEKAAMVFATNEIEPIQDRMRELNDWAGEEIIRFDPYRLASANDAALLPLR